MRKTAICGALIALVCSFTTCMADNSATTTQQKSAKKSQTVQPVGFHQSCDSGACDAPVISGQGGFAGGCATGNCGVGIPSGNGAGGCLNGNCGNAGQSCGACGTPNCGGRCRLGLGGQHGDQGRCVPHNTPNLPVSSLRQYWRSNSCNANVWDGYQNKCSGGSKHTRGECDCFNKRNRGCKGNCGGNCGDSGCAAFANAARQGAAGAYASGACDVAAFAGQAGCDARQAISVPRACDVPGGCDTPGGCDAPEAYSAQACDSPGGCDSRW